MKVRLLSYKNSKLQAIMCLRGVCPYMSLQMGKSVCESLPFEIHDVPPEMVEDLRRCFTFDLNAGESVLWVRKAWNSLSQERQDGLLHYLVVVGMLKEK